MILLELTPFLRMSSNSHFSPNPNKASKAVKDFNQRNGLPTPPAPSKGGATSTGTFN
jgi:hypothetical protein